MMYPNLIEIGREMAEWCLKNVNLYIIYYPWVYLYIMYK